MSKLVLIPTVALGFSLLTISASAREEEAEAPVGDDVESRAEAPSENSEEEDESQESNTEGYRRYIVAGYLVSGFSYLAGLLPGALMIDSVGWTGLVTLLPVLGPAILAISLFSEMAAYEPTDSLDNGAWGYGVGAILCLLTALFQASGVVALVQGYVRRARGRRDGEEQRRRAGVAFVPAVAEGPGVAVAGWF